MNRTHADPIDEALDSLKSTRSSFCHAEMAAPWRLPVDGGCPKYYFVMAGSCRLQMEGGEAHELSAGDFAILIRGAGHELRSTAPTPSSAGSGVSRHRLGERIERLRREGGGECTTFICGDIQFEGAAADHVAALLPGVLRVRAGQYQILDWLYCTSRLMAFESSLPGPGAEAFVSRLVNIMVIQAMRGWIAENPDKLTGWLGSFRDPSIGRAIALIHDRPGFAWNVESLAKQVAMSRSAFSEQFTALVGESVMQYLGRWRMLLADNCLRDGRTGLEEIALQLGYQSGSAFSRAYKKSRGMTPGRFRRMSRGAPREARATAA
ncbi:MAG TPA: AraC family transcriptional regulator [Opitutaceae bacterium]